MLRFKQLSELFDKPKSFNWGRKDTSSWLGTFFTSNTQHVQVIINREEGNIWNFIFVIDGETKLTGKGEEIEIFSTVIAMVLAFIKSQKPSHISFTAKEPSRVKLYQTLIKRLKKKVSIKSVAKEKLSSGNLEFMVEF